MESDFLNHYRKVLSLSDDEFNEFSASCRRPLPVTLRIEDKRIRDFIIKHFTGTAKVHNLFEPNYVLQLDADEFKASEIKPAVLALTEAGLLYRQEVVSMLPVFYLKVDPNHIVLDMCAAPGSKTTQILQILKKGSGMLISNDVNPRRCSVLSMHASKQCCSSHLVTANDARFFPKMSFDRILCDVPCSGDGTVRKSPSKIQRWKFGDSKGLGALQYDILKRGLELLKEDGILCYSTCSLSPFENEAIVQRALENLDCELADLPCLNPSFKIRPGMVSWSVPESIGTESWMHPCKLNIGLEKCGRILPHDNNTGGFFVALFRKKRAHAEICLKLSDDCQAGITLGLDGRLCNNFLQAGFHIRDLNTNQEAGFSLTAGLESNQEISGNPEGSQNTSAPVISDDVQLLEYPERRAQNPEITESDQPASQNISILGANSRGDKHTAENDDVHGANIGKSDQITADSTQHRNSCGQKEPPALQTIHGLHTNHSSTIPSVSQDKGRYIKDGNAVNMECTHTRLFLRSLVCKDKLYEIDDSLKTSIEQCFDIEIRDKLISHSETKNKVSVISDRIYEILKKGPKSLRVVSAGAVAFNENNLRGSKLYFRAYRGILEKYGYNGHVIKLNETETLAVIENESIGNEKIVDKMPKKGVGVFQLHNVDGLFCGVVFETKTTIYISKKMRNAIKFLIKQ